MAANYSSPEVTNCIVWDNEPDSIYDGADSDSDVTYSDVETGTVFPYSGTGNINEDPLLANPDLGDFHLLSDSPCIDEGSGSAQALPSEDCEGDPRVVGEYPDMGADEYTGAPNISANPSQLDFGKVETGEESSLSQVTVENTGDAELVLGTIAVTGAQAASFQTRQDHCSDETLAAVTGSCTVGVVFVPSASGAANATLSIPSNDQDEPVSEVSLSGQGVGVIDSPQVGASTVADMTDALDASVTVVLTGEVSPAGAETTFYFEYGPTEGYGTQTAPVSAGVGETWQTVSQTIAGLDSDSTYYYRLAVQNAGGTATGEGRYFATDIFYVDENSGCGDREPCRDSIQSAIIDVMPGGWVKVASGEYGEQVSVDRFATVAPGYKPDFSGMSQEGVVLKINTM